jgi:hypothetical protein
VYSDIDRRREALTPRPRSLKYSRPGLREINAGLVALGNCSTGPQNQGSCRGGNVAFPGECSYGQVAGGTCNVGGTPQQKNCGGGADPRAVLCATGTSPSYRR